MSYEDDKVVLVLGGQEIRIATGFKIHQSLMRQPAEFELTLGRGSIEDDPRKGPTVRDILYAYPPNTPFKLLVNGNPRLVGRTDGYRASAAGGQASEVTIFGRDVLAPLHDAHIDREQSFSDATYKSLVATVLKYVGLDPGQLTTTGALPDRQLRAGIKVKELLPVRTIDEILKGEKEDGRTGYTAGASHSSLQTKPGDRWMDFLRKQLDRAGLFLWAGGDGKIILSAPNPEQEPLYQIVRKRGQLRNAVNVLHADLLNDTRPRYTFGIVYGRSSGRGKNKRQVSVGDSTDDEMLNTYKFGYDFEGKPINTRAVVIRDKHCQNNAQASYLAQRKLAEARRSGWQLCYTLAGLSIEALSGGRAVWTPDTVVKVVDEEFGISGNFWIESVEMSRKPYTTTTIRLMRSFDVVFGTPDFEGAPTGVATGFKGPTKLQDILGGSSHIIKGRGYKTHRAPVGPEASSIPDAYKKYLESLSKKK